MKHTHFHIYNFKGIADIRFDLMSHPQSHVYTLVGLNESGKTTILEAINFVNYHTETTKALDFPGTFDVDSHDLIPISKKANFTDSIFVEAVYNLDYDDEENIRQFCKKELGFQLTKNLGRIVIKRMYQYTDSKIVANKSVWFWTITLEGKRKGARKPIFLSSQEDEWQPIVAHIRTLLPSIIYFPNFLFEVPDKIYLELTGNDRIAEIHSYYKLILQDILESLDDNLELSRHILLRAKSGDQRQKEHLDAVLLKMGNNITQTIVKQWNQIFGKRLIGKEIRVSWNEDDKGIYLQMRIRDNNELYKLSERSLGFRWFFAYMLLTQYRGFRKDATGGVLFLLDEPASNLHPSAQSQLLKSFEKLQGSSIIYTTHSHHMINPAWLEGTYVVKNDGISYEGEDDDYTARNTIITLKRYREFAVEHPDQLTYFKPILDVLDYCPSQLENVPDVVMLEGKNDFYMLKYFTEILLGSSHQLNLMPGGGAGTLDSPIRLYLAWGRDFIVLLDSDDAGTKQRERYINLFGEIVKDRIFTLADIMENWRGKGMEYLIEDEDRKRIQTAIYTQPEGYSFNKTHFNRAIQELYLLKRGIEINENSRKSIEGILGFCADKLGLSPVNSRGSGGKGKSL